MVFALLVAMGTACLSDPSAPFGHHLEVTPQAITFAALGDTVRLTAAEVGPGATRLPTPTVVYTSEAPTVANVDSNGLLTSHGNGVTWIVARVSSGDMDSVPVTVVQQPSRVVASGDTLWFEALGAVQALGANVVDRLGTAIPGLGMEYTVDDTTVAFVASDGQVRARGNGLTAVRVTGAGESLQVVIHVQQRPVRVLGGTDTLRFDALGDSTRVVAIAVDSLGSPVTGGTITDLVADDTTVLEVVDSVTLRAKENGQTVVRFFSAGLPVEQVVTVSQVPDTIVVFFAETLPILSLSQDSLIPLTCRVLDRNGFSVGIEPTILPSSSGHWSGNTCDALRALTSGRDTLRLTVGSTTAAVPIVLAVRPTASSQVGEWLFVDSLPSGTLPWAPSARVNSRGQTEVYVALGRVGGAPPGSDLHRLISDDGLHFRYDGEVLSQDPDPCSLNGTGVENVAVVPRNDGPGWRMYYASGSDGCYGWQVFSATSTDERTWVREPGVRLSNGGPLPPAPPRTPPWPAGEGMVVEQVQSGEWRMIVSTYEHVLPRIDKWQITEWRSPDQLQWSYVGVVLHTDNMPPEGQSSVYSPTIREFAPGLWRMIFTADNRGKPQGRSALWSAVSTDKTRWQVEGELVGVVGTNLYYSALVGGKVVFIRQDAGAPPQLGVATITMP